MEKGVFLGLDGRAALVTGAGSLVGRTVAFWLARGGCDVAIVDSSKEAAERVAEELRELDFTAIAVGADVRSERQAEAMVAEVLEKFDALEIAVNCPAAPPVRYARAAAREGRPRSDFDEAVMASCCRAEARAMVAAAEGGALINLAWSSSELVRSSSELVRSSSELARSSSELTRNPSEVVWNASELPGNASGLARDAREVRLSGAAAEDMGLDGLTRRLAAELGPGGVRVNGILAILGSARGAGRAGPARRRQAASLDTVIPAEDLGRVAVLLASDLARTVTGQVFRVDARARGPVDPSGAMQGMPEGAAGSRR